MKTVTEIAERLSKLSKSTHADILSMWIDEIAETISEELSHPEIDVKARRLIDKTLKTIKNQVNGE